MYANVTKEQKDKIVASYRGSRSLCTYSDPGHWTAIAANDVLCKTNKQWNGKTGSNAFAAAMATLVMAKEIKLVDISA